MNQIRQKLVVMLAVLVGSVVGFFKGAEAKQKWVYRIKSHYEEKKIMADRKSTLENGGVLLDEIEMAAFHSNNN